MPRLTSLKVSPRYLYPFRCSDVFLEGTPPGETTVTVDPCRAVTAYAPPAMPISLTTVRSPTIDTVTARPVLGKASGPDYGAGGRSWSDGGGCPGKCHGDGETMPEASPPIPARPRRTGSDMGAISSITL